MAKKMKVILEELNALKKQLSEDYMFNGDDGVMDEPQGVPMQGEGEMASPQQMMGQGDSEEEVAMHAQEVIQHEPIIGKIRETSIEGLKKYADHPTSEIYNFFKKVFLDSDKVLTGEGKGK